MEFIWTSFIITVSCLQNESGSAPFTEDEARSSDQLREVIKYLRRERDVTSGKCEVAQAENQRLEAQRNILKSQVDKLTKDLSEEREKNQVREACKLREIRDFVSIFFMYIYLAHPSLLTFLDSRRWHLLYLNVSQINIHYLSASI